MPRQPLQPADLLKSRSKEMSSGCVEWTGPISRYGYGVFSSALMGRTGAHRAAWTLHRGEIPEGLSVLHRCNNPACVNIEHLFLGTHDDNMVHRRESGHYANGNRHPNAKLTDEDARKIYEDSRTDGVIAAEFGVHRSIITDIRNGKSWLHITGGLPSPHKPPQGVNQFTSPPK